VTVANPLEISGFNPADFPADYLKEIGPSLIVAAGLGRRDLVPEVGRVAASA
jgi:hypothetical protein